MRVLSPDGHLESLSEATSKEAEWLSLSSSTSYCIGITS
jgi:hypothetical protein